MKVLKYIFTIPFNPNREWNTALIEIQKRQTVREDALKLFFLTVLIFIASSYLQGLFMFDSDLSIYKIILIYLSSLISIMLSIAALKLFKSKQKYSDLSVEKIGIIYLYGTTIPFVISSFIKNYFFWEYYNFYLQPVIMQNLIDAVFIFIFSAYVAMGFLNSRDLVFRDKKLLNHKELIIHIFIRLFLTHLFNIYIVNRYLFSFISIYLY